MGGTILLPLWTSGDLLAPRECWCHLRGVAISTPNIFHPVKLFNDFVITLG